MAKKSEIVGGAAAAPADAPQESTQPIKPELTAVQQQAARAHEKDLKPLVGPKGPPLTPEQAAVALGVSIEEARAIVAAGAGTVPQTTGVISQPTRSDIEDFFGGTDPSSTMEPPAPALAVPEPVAPTPTLPVDFGSEADDLPVVPALTDEDRARMPAASEGEGPAKGILPGLTAPTGDKFEGLSRGGFGDAGEAQYFPLDGNELRELVLALFDTLAASMTNDLRFSMGLTYPRARVRVQVIVEGEDEGSGLQIERVHVPKLGEKGSTPEAIARTLGDRIAFVVTAKREEFTEAGEVSSPPDQIRDDLGVAKPQRQIIDTGLGPMQVDVLPSGDLRAIMGR